MDANGNVTTYDYDGHDRLFRLNLPSKNKGTISSPNLPDGSDYEHYSYDPNGNMLTKRKRDGKIITMTYDALNRIIKKSPQGQTAVEYRYNRIGLQIEVKFAGSAASIRHHYDSAGRLSSTNDRGRTLSYAYDKASNRTMVKWPDQFYVTYTDGDSYRRLKVAMNRLQGTQIETNIYTGSVEQIDIFSLIDKVKIIRETRDGRMLDIEITLSDWVFNAIEAKEVLTYNQNYFRLRKPLERRFYDLARKHCGQQAKWSISLTLLHKKSGSSSNKQEFRRLLIKIVEDDKIHNHIPDYSIHYDDENKMVTFINRNTEQEKKAKDYELNNSSEFPILNPETYDKARKIAPSFDVYYLEQEWRGMWINRGREKLRNPDGAFIAFCKRRFEHDKNRLL